MGFDSMNIMWPLYACFQVKVSYGLDVSYLLISFLSANGHCAELLRSALEKDKKVSGRKSLCLFMKELKKVTE